jgi:hypothetical protein
MKQSSYAWSRAYARQAQADLEAREALLGAPAPACQHLHFLQMACEKIAKAHRCLGGAAPETLMYGHGFAAKVLPQVARELLRRSTFVADLQVKHVGIEAMVRQLAREVDRTIASTPGKTPEAPFMCRPSTGSGLSKRYTGVVQGRRFLRL